MSAHTESRHFPPGELSAGDTPLVLPRTTDPRRTSPQTLIDISHRLRPRDYTIASLLDEHTTLTTVFGTPATWAEQEKRLSTSTDRPGGQATRSASSW